MGIENIRELKFRYVVRYPKTGTVHTFIRTLDQIEKSKEFPGNPYQVIAKNQYVNYKDKNGFELFEHDVVHILSSFGKEPIIGVVRWRHGSFIIEPLTNTYGNSIFYFLHCSKLVKVGDLYNNKKPNKLITGEKPCVTKSLKKEHFAGGI